MPNIHIIRLSLFYLLVVEIVGQMSFVRMSYSLNPNYAKSVSSLYTFAFNVYNPETGTINLRVDFPNNFVLSTVTDCQVKLGSTPAPDTTCSLDLTTNQVVINNIIISTTFSTIQVQFRTATSKYSATSTITFAFFNASSSAAITTNPQLIQIQNALMSCSLTSNTNVVGGAATYTVQFQPSVQIEAGSVVQLQFDPWGPFSRSNFLTTNTTSVCNGQCSISLLPSFGVQLIVFSSLYGSATNNSNSLTLNNARNPSSFAPLRLVIVVSAGDGSSIYMTGSTTFSASSTNTFNGVIFDLPIKSISLTNSNVNLRINLRNPLNSNTFLRVMFPQQISCSYIFGFNSLSTVPTQITGQPSGQVLLGNLARSTITSEPTVLSIGNFTVVNPPFSQKPVTITFRTEQLINSVYYLIDQTSLQITSTTSSISQSGVRPQILNIGSITTYELWFVTINRLISGSFIIITFPQQILISTTESVCTLITSGVQSRCSVASSTSIRLILDSIANAASNLTLTITRVTNPLLTAPTNSFSIRTYYLDDTSLVDQLTTGLAITATQVPLRAVTVTPTSLTVNARTTYTFNIQTSFEVPTSSIIKIYFPVEFKDGAQTLQSFSIDGIAVTGCLVSISNSSYLQFSNLCIRSTVSNTQTISIRLSNVLNPSSFKPTSSFSVQVINGIYRQQFLSTGIFVTMTETAAIPFFKVTPTTAIANQNNVYKFEVNFQIRRYSGDRVILKFPSDVILSNTFECTSQTTNMTISCSKTNSQTLLFVLNFISTIYPGQSIKFTVQNFTNMWYTTTRTFSVQTTTNDTTFYYQQQGSTVVSYQPATMTATINVDNNIVLLGDSKLSVSLNSPFRLDRVADSSQLYIFMRIPTDLIPKPGTCVSSYGSSVCTQPTNQQFNITGISDFSSTLNVKFTATTSFFQTSSAFDIKLYYGSNLVLSNSQLKALRYCQPPCKQCTAIRTQCMSCLPSPFAGQKIYFSFNSSCVTGCPDNYYLVSATLSCGRCSSSACLNCINSATQCTSCQANRFLFNMTCLSVCPEGYYSINLQCLACSSPCSTCTGQATICQSCVNQFFLDYGSNSSRCVRTCTNTNYLGVDGQCKQCTSNCRTCSVSLSNCTSCDQTVYYFYQNSCIRNCPVGMYNNPNGVCTVCQSPCLTCTTRLNCESCVSNFYLFNVTNCVAVCPNGYVQKISNCVLCDQKCATCSISAWNCTSCPSGSYFYQNSCLANCPVGMYNNPNGTCTVCESPCKTCSTRLNCDSCLSNYYMFNGTNCVTQCPNGFIEQVSTCVSCDSKCSTCSVTGANCTSCPSGTYFYQNDCYTTCPALTYPFNRTCTRCISPCVTCASSPQICLTCIQGLLLLDTSCVTSCPLSGYIEEDNKCLACPSNCLSCQTSINCSLCNNEFFLLQGGCVDACPVNYPIITNRQCSQCDDVCLTCQTTRQNCTSCKINLFRHFYTCVASCPIGYYSNVRTYECQDGLSTKIVFFPILIMSIIIVAFVCVVKCLALNTSLTTSLTSLLSLAQMAIWIFMIIELSQPFKELNVDYTLPIIMNVVALGSLLIQNIVFFILELKKMEQDDFVRGWATNNVNYTVLVIHRYVGLVLNFKFFRFCYSRFFNIRTLSLPFKNSQNIFPLTTVFSILNFILCQVPMMVCSFSLAYKKLIKDQLFYTSIQCLILTIGCAVLLLIDIFKSEDYFEESDYVKTRKYLQKIKDASFNQLEDHFDITQNEGSIDGQKYVSKTGGKFIFSKQEAGNSLKELYFQQEAGSVMTDAMQTVTAKGDGNKGQQNRKTKQKKINIFDPIKQQDQQIYEDLKYSEHQIKTQAQIESEKIQLMDQHRQQDHAISYHQIKSRRLMELGVNTEGLNWDDNMSMVEERPLKQKWNDIIDHRQKLSRSIFNTIDIYPTKQLGKIMEPIDEDQFEEDNRHHNQQDRNREKIEDPFWSTEYGKTKKNKRRKRKGPNQPNNSELQKIYLQRLTQKKKYKDIFASSQSIKYDF